MILRLFVLLQLLCSLESLLAWLTLVNDLAELSLALTLLSKDCFLFLEDFFANRLKISNSSLGVVNVIFLTDMHLVVEHIIELNSAGATYDLFVVLDWQSAASINLHYYSLVFNIKLIIFGQNSD